MRLPVLLEGLSIGEARRGPAGVEFRLSIAALRQSIDLGRLRQAMLSAEATGGR
jgi:hypothetical protein